MRRNNHSTTQKYSSFLKAAWMVLMVFVLIPKVNAQFIDIQIDLPARSEVKAMESSLEMEKSNPGKEKYNSGNVSPDEDATLGETGKTKLKWFSVGVAENVELAVTISYKQVPNGETLAEAAYLNDGSDNILGAQPFSGNRQLFPVYNKGRLIRKLPGKPRALYAWIGFPPYLTNELLIEYN